MGSGAIFLLAYLCSGVAGLVYEVTWTRLLTLYMGHTIAAATTVVASFMGGLAGGAALGGAFASGLTRRQSLIAYAALESVVAVLALLLPLELSAVVPLLARTYANGAPGLVFPIVRVFASLVLLFIPALALGATFPMAVRWFVRNPDRPGGAAGALYFANTSGAAVGAAGAGFLLIPLLGLFGTTLVGVGAGAVAVAVALILTRTAGDERFQSDRAKPRHAQASSRSGPIRRVRPGPGDVGRHEKSAPPNDEWRLAAAVLGCTGFATLMYEIAWTRIFGLAIGPSTYAFAATVTAVIAGTAGGSALGSAIAGRVRSPAAALLVSLGAAAAASGWAGSMAGMLPHFVVDQLRAAPAAGAELLVRQGLLAAGVMAPAAVALGVAFPLALDLAGRREAAAPRRLGSVYAVNTLAAVAGALIAGFVALPVLGLFGTLRLTTAVLIAAALLVMLRGSVSRGARFAGLIPTIGAVGFVLFSSPWDREMLASGPYRYARYAVRSVDPEEVLKAGTLLYYRDGAVATVTVKRLTGALSLSIDGKVDASTSGDMLTQKALGHLPLLLHGDAHEVCIIGLGSGVTLASALLHPISSADVLELSPEVVAASRLFTDYNHNALEDPRTHLIVGDGRSHMLLTTRKYDVIVSEPSNPWMAGVAALFTREFFTALRDRLTAAGILCQWMHTYDISEEDLRSVVATFVSVFPGGTMWLVGESDLLLVGSVAPLEPRLDNIEKNWGRPGVAADLAQAGAAEPFAFYSLFVGGPNELRRFAGGAPLQTDDRMALEFSGPRAVYGASVTVGNVAALRGLLDPRNRPATVARAYASAGPAEWRNRASMMLKADAYAIAYQDYVTAARRISSDSGTLAGLVRASVAAHRQTDAETFLTELARAHPREPAIRVALSKILAASGRLDEAIAEAREACDVAPADSAGWEQLASIFADLNDGDRLDAAVEMLQRTGPTRATASYYAAASAFLHGRLDAGVDLANKAIARDPQYAAAQNLLGAIHASRGDVQAARHAFEAALALNPQDSATYINLGLLALSSRNSNEAAKWFVEALSLDPGSESAQKGLEQARESLPH